MGAAPVHAQLQQPGVAPARGPDAPKADPSQQSAGSTGQAADPQAPIVPDSEFSAALPPLSGDINAPLEPMDMTERPEQSAAQPTAARPNAAVPAAQTSTDAALVPVGPEDPQLAQPLTPLASFDSTPLQTAAAVEGKDAPQIRYETVVKGLDALDLDARFKALSALREGGGKAANATQVAARAREDEQLAVRLMKSLGYYDGTATSVIEQNPANSGRLRAIVTASPGRLYTLSSVTVQANQTVPADLVRRELPLKVGDPIQADRIQGAEANVSLKLPQQGYPFVKVGERDILLEDQSPQATGAYTLPVDTGPRSSFGQLTTAGDPVFDLDHLNVFPRFKQGELYDNRLADDLRDALVATSLFNGVSVVPQRTGRPGPDGTEQVDLLVTQTRGPARSLSGEGGYSTGQGLRLTGSWTHRNLFPPEGALIGSVVAGTQQQGLSGTFRRSNAGRRDRTFTAIASADHTNYDAFNAFTGTLSARWSYDSTPIWQKRFTYYYGGEIVGTNESVYDFDQGKRVRRTYGIAALPGQVQFDTSDNLLNPTKGYRLKLNLSPESAVGGGGFHPYARTMVEATYYYGVSPSLVIAGRARAGGIFGIDRDDLAPSRRYYGGGGGSVRGYGYQRLGPFDPNGDPVGGRSLNEFALEARYRFGNFGIVPFVDAGNSYESSLPKGSDLRFGAGIGGRFYTNFGPLRVDVATPLNKRPGDGRIALYISIGQAF
ncbi:autotransporter secretion outer membrane protein TamA [Sphingomonas gellani]|uniref:Autotransporter secretion outer membrane protein TamA n=1 Tax=Sphingomonas gellani TaxID=1166340 RepID=A0A1H8EUF3_9SPHN|nr:BamA/TamA family outer membrane protein [Sphingomonas gellani]SEN23105.1 autotransporter secretion outer membrane protein TamA [Sphingomonas gellani]